MFFSDKREGINYNGTSLEIELVLVKFALINRNKNIE
jgi:hypothetical protein